MKKFLILPLLFTCYMGMGQAPNPASIIGKPIIIGNLQIAQYDFPNDMNWYDARKACAALGKGWRLPTRNDLNILYINRVAVGNFVNYIYWSNETYGLGAWFHSFYIGYPNDALNKNYKCFVRAVRSL